MKKLIVMLLILPIGIAGRWGVSSAESLSSGSSLSLQAFLYPYKIYPSGSIIIHDRLHGVYLIKPNRRSFVFNSFGTTARQILSETSGAIAVINASYFGFSGGNFIPAGIYAPDPSPIDSTHCERDKNICELVNLDTLSFTGFQPVVKSPTVSAGPLLLKDGIIPDNLFQKYSHRQKRNYRTVLLDTKVGPVFLITKKQFSLPRLASYIRTLFGKVNALNLDGGSSTTLSTSSSPTFQRNPKKRLPTFFVLY